MNEKTILRAQFDGCKGAWKIVKKTFNGAGGWAKFAEWYLNKETDERYIDSLVADFPELYEKEP